MTDSPENDAEETPEGVEASSHSIKGRKRWFQRYDFRAFVVSALVALASWVSPAAREIIFHGVIAESWHTVVGWVSRSPERWTVLVVLPDPTASTVSVPMLEALQLSVTKPKRELLANVDLEYVPEARTPEETAEILKDKMDDVLLIIGHERSTTVQYLIANVYRSPDLDDGPMPLLIPAATNPMLTSAQEPGQQHILRLPATDGKQIDCILQFIKNQRNDDLADPKPPAKRSTAFSVGVIRDRSNPAYSDYIGEEIVAKSDDVDQSIGVDLGGADIPLSILNHDFVVVAGMERLAKVFLTRIHNIRGAVRAPPQLVFTDGVAGEVFYSAANNTLHNEPHEDHQVWMCGPFAPLVGKGHELTARPNYSSYGVLARDVAEELIRKTRDANHDALSRAAVRDTIQSWLNGSTTQPASVRFDQRGDNQLASFHMFGIKGKQTFHAKNCCCGN